MRGLCLALLFCSAIVVAAQEKQRELVTVTNCIWVAHKDNDGDSFHILSGTNSFTVRLYDVDCAGIKATTPERHAAQTNFFKADGKALRKVGADAARFTSNQLARPFSIVTRYAHSYGGPRVLAYVITADGQDLGGLLVSNGLARAHGGKYNGPPCRASPVTRPVRATQAGPAGLRPPG